MTTPGHLIAYDLDGPAGAPVVVLGGSIGTNRTMWDEQLPALRKQFRVVRYDHRGHGGSPVPAGPYSLADLGGDVLALLDHLEIDRAHHVGLSLGGMVAMWLAAHAPDRVDRLALISTSAHLPPGRAWDERAAMVRAHGPTSVAPAVLARWFTPAFAGSPRAAALAADLLQVPSEGYAGCCEAIAGLDLRADLSAIQADTLVIAGEQDPATPPAMATQIAAGLSGRSRVEVVGTAAHLASVEQAPQVTALLLAHLTR